MAVGGKSVRLCVAVNVDCTCEVAVIVTTFEVVFGIVAGAVYKPPAVIVPVPVPLTLQFTSVLLRLMTLAVHCEVPSKVTSVGVQDTVIVGVVAVVLEPQELRIPTAASNPKQSKRRSQRTLPHPK
jgi:hypothetical protein